MAKLLDPKEVVTADEIVITNMVEISALIELLMEKGIINQARADGEVQETEGEVSGEVGVYLNRDSSVLSWPEIH